MWLYYTKVSMPRQMMLTNFCMKRGFRLHAGRLPISHNALDRITYTIPPLPPPPPPFITMGDQYDVLKTGETVFHHERSIQNLMYVFHFKPIRIFSNIILYRTFFTFSLAARIRSYTCLLDGFLFRNDFITYVSIFKVSKMFQINKTYSFSLKLLFFVV